MNFLYYIPLLIIAKFNIFQLLLNSHKRVV